VEPLNPQDQALISALYSAPRATAVELGDAIGMSAPTVSNHLRRLVHDGVVEVIGVLDYRAWPSAFMAVMLLRGTDVELLDELPDRRGVVFAAQTFGPHDALVSVIDSSPGHMERTIDWLRGRTQSVETNVILDVTVNGLTRHDPAGLRDALDDDIACLLSTNARMTFAALAETLNIPEATARSRAQRLLRAGTVTPLVIPHPTLFGLNASGALAITVNTPAKPIHDALLQIPGVITTLQLQGRFALAAEVLAPDLTALGQLRDTVAGIDGVRDVEVLPYGRRVTGRWPLPARDRD
jgi:Lrp/AsnC family transcriptional regulator, regulator for asnA, asnC and gidA